MPQELDADFKPLRFIPSASMAPDDGCPAAAAVGGRKIIAQGLAGAEDNRCPGFNKMIRDKMHTIPAAVKHHRALLTVEAQGAECNRGF
ncbi:MAG: hypothetical protein QNJ61_00520 [Desulfobacterales bacterium]|nr:hypothetical protein [Desulfobacterales bacterium]